MRVRKCDPKLASNKPYLKTVLCQHRQQRMRSRELPYLKALGHIRRPLWIVTVVEDRTKLKLSRVRNEAKNKEDCVEL